MATDLTTATEIASQQLSLQPQLIFELEGVPTLFGAVEIMEIIRIGDSGLLIGNDWVIGGTRAVEDQLSALSLEGSSNEIRQQIEPDKGSVSSVSAIQIALLDINNAITEIITPGMVVGDILGLKGTLYFAFQGTSHPEDSIRIFSGIVDDIESMPGKITLNLSNPEQLKRGQTFPQSETQLNGAINNAVATIPVDDSTNFAVPVPGPDGVTIDPSLGCYIRIDDEIVKYTGRTTNSFTGCTRGQLGTTAAAHSDDAKVSSYFVLEGNPIDLALKIMLSGKNGYWKTGVEITSFVACGAAGDVTDTIFFVGVDVADKYGLIAGDWFASEGSAESANNVGPLEITSITKTEDGSYITVSGAGFVRELDSAGTISFRSQFDTLGMGLGMDGDQVDVAQHIYWKDLLLGGDSLLIYIKEAIDNTKDFMDLQLYAPVGAYSIPRSGRCSMGYHIGPIPGANTVILNKDSIRNPSKIKLKRSLSRNFYNTVEFRGDESPTEDKFLQGWIYVDGDSYSRIKAGAKVFKFESKGLRSNGSAGGAFTQRIANRLLSRYRFGAEYIQGIQIFLKKGFNVEPGDIVILDGEDLKISNTKDGTRDLPATAYECINRTINFKTGNVTLDLVNTNYDLTERYGLIGPSSYTGSGSTATRLVIVESFGGYFPGQEYRKWSDYEGLNIRVHSVDFSFDETVTLSHVDQANRNVLVLDSSTPLSGPPPAGYIIDLAEYPTNSDKSDQALAKQLTAYLSPSVGIVSSGAANQFDVAGGDIGKFFEDTIVRIHNEDFTDDSGDIKVTGVSGTTVTLAEDVSFSMGVTHTVELIGFADGQQAYRFI